jgi:23S rRNA pseudouridine1911/1915/1917 synthase
VAPPRLLTADRGDAGRRLDLVLRRHLTDIHTASRTRVQAWIASGRVTVNGTPVRRVATRAALGDLVAVALPAESVARRREMAPEDVTLDILFEDEHLLALNKPAGVVMHPSYKNAAGTLLNALLWHARGWPVPQRPSLVGRLDKLTSGVVVVAKTAAIHAALQRTMAAAAEKDYLAVVYGRVNVARGEIDLRLAKDRRDPRRVVASAHVGAASLTRFERLARVAAPAVGLSLVRCRLVTGRTHQIRVHLRRAAGRSSATRRTANPVGRRSRGAARRGGARLSAPGAPRLAGRREPSVTRGAPDLRGAGAPRPRRADARGWPFAAPMIVVLLNPAPA